MSSRGPDLDCEECVNAAPYVLGALEDHERFREHLAACASCRAEVAELQLAANLLPEAVSPAVASDELRERVLATVRSEAELLQAAGHRADDPPRLAGLQRPRRLSPFAVGVALAAAVAVLVAIALGGGSAARERVTPALIAPPGARASLRLLGGRGELVVSGMPQPPAGKIYELWLNRGAGSPQPTDALFGVTSRGSCSVGVPSNLHGVKEVLVTSEPLGGSSHPTSAPILRVVVPA
jgi:hypothetical protein